MLAVAVGVGNGCASTQHEAQVLDTNLPGAQLVKTFHHGNLVGAIEGSYRGNRYLIDDGAWSGVRRALLKVPLPPAIAAAYTECTKVTPTPKEVGEGDGVVRVWRKNSDPGQLYGLIAVNEGSSGGAGLDVGSYWVDVANYRPGYVDVPDCL